MWDLSAMPKSIENPILAWFPSLHPPSPLPSLLPLFLPLSILHLCKKLGEEAEINQLQWSSTQPDWISITFENKMQILRV
jgi:hypothetical protein